MVVRWHGAEAEAHMRAAAARGLNKAATVLKVASQKLAPVDTTDLRKSAATHDATPANLESAVTYDTPYAVIQHERLDFNHPTDHNPNAQAKYLEGPAGEMREQLVQIVATEIKREMRS